MPRRPRQLLRHRNLAIGAVLTGALVFAAVLSPFWTPYDATAIDVSNKLQGASAAHWFGTDRFGRDILSMIMVGARNSIAVGVVAVGIGLAAGLPLGLWAAMRRGWVEETLMRMTDLTFAFPAVLTAIMITALAGPGAVNAITAIGIFNIAVFSRVSRGAALQVLGRPFILSAAAIGRTPADIALRHVLPNMGAVLIVQATIQFAVAILAEAGLSYLGLGVQPPAPSWGKMLNDAQTLIFLHPSQAVYPGLAIAFSVLGLNLLGDGLRDVLDPRLRLWRAV